jgi:hypothetical protein
MTAIEVRRAFTPGEVDDMELWVIAELLGVNDDPVASGGGLVTEEQFREASAALLERRVRAAEAGSAPPSVAELPPSATPEVTPAMIEALRQRRAQREAAKGA